MNVFLHNDDVNVIVCFYGEYREHHGQHHCDQNKYESLNRHRNIRNLPRNL